MGSQSREAATKVIREPIDGDDGMQMPGIRLRDAEGSALNAVTLEEFGDHVEHCRRFTVQRRNIPLVVEAFADHAREDDLPELEARVNDAVHWGEASDGTD